MTWLTNIFGDRTLGAIRSSEWPAFRKANIKKECEFCGSKWFLNLHHILPFHIHPELELDEKNVVTLCKKHHFELGHFFSWYSWNEDIKNWIRAKQFRP